MSAAAPAAPTAHSLPIDFNAQLFEAVAQAVPKAMSMCGVKATCVGVSRMPSKQDGEVTGMIGAHGDVSGFVSVNMSTRLALHVVECLLGEGHQALNPEVVDGAGEVTNMIVGGIKSALSRSEWAFSHMTVPSVIVGEGYQVAYAKGIELIDVAFECDNEQAIVTNDRLLHVTLSLLKL